MGLGEGLGSWLRLSGRGARTPMTGGASGVGCGVCADDHARIKLKVESSPSRSDYINASPIVSGLAPAPTSSPLSSGPRRLHVLKGHHHPTRGPGIVGLIS